MINGNLLCDAGLRRKASRTKRGHLEDLIPAEEFDARRNVQKRGRRSHDKISRASESPKKKFMRSVGQFF